MESCRFCSFPVAKSESNFGLLLILILTNLPAVWTDLFAERRHPDSVYGQRTPSSLFIHTFETAEQCAMICLRPCVDQVLEELEMMQRWICDPSRFQKEETTSGSSNTRRSHHALDNGTKNGIHFLHNQILLIIVPLSLIIILSLIIMIRRCSFKSSIADV